MKLFKSSKKDFAIFACVLLTSLLAIAALVSKPEETSIVTISEFMKMNSKKEVVSVEMGIDKLIATIKSGDKITVAYPIFYSTKIIDTLIANNVAVNFVNDNGQGRVSKVFTILGSILSWLPIILMGWIAVGFIKGMSGGGKPGNSGGFFGGGPFQFGKSKARMMAAKDIKVTFADIAGVDEAKKDVTEIVDFLKHPQKYRKIGGVIPRGCLLIGYPGTGKTLLARAIAGEAGVPFYFISGSDFVEMFVGVGASRVREMFAEAKAHVPCIIFIDEIDAVGRHRGAGMGSGNDEREQTLNQLLVEMDGFEENNGVVILAATNRPDVLDPALLRPGRFDRQITISLPDINGREEILAVHMKKIKYAPSVNIRTIAKGTPGFSGADLANIVNEAALLAARDGKEIVTNKEFEDARDKILMGGIMQTVIRQEEREITAYHEAGHAIIAHSLPDSDPIHKITIIPRRNALGMVVRLPGVDSFSRNENKIIADIIVGLGGRVAEVLKLGPGRITSGASSDIEMVTKLARSMVTEWGMSKKIGMVCHAKSRRESYLDRSGESVYQASQETAAVIDHEVRRIIDECYEKAIEILTKRNDDFELLAKTLLEVETITGEQLTELLTTRKIVQDIRQNDVVKSVFGGILSGDGTDITQQDTNATQ